MSAAYFEGRLKTSIAMMNAATDPSARMAHSRLAAGYRALVIAARPIIAQCKSISPRPDTEHALAGCADDGGASREA